MRKKIIFYGFILSFFSTALYSAGVDLRSDSEKLAEAPADKIVGSLVTALIAQRCLGYQDEKNVLISVSRYHNIEAVMINKIIIDNKKLASDLAKIQISNLEKGKTTCNNYISIYNMMKLQ